MTTVTPRPMSLVRVDFADLYARHLCRHSQLGINVAHLAALFGVWFGVYGFIHALVRADWLPVGLAAAYLALVAVNAPLRVSMATGVFLALFVAAVLGLPELPLWVYALLVPVCYKLQSWSHKLFTAVADMTEFNKRYPKGFVLFVVLLVYEVPMLLNYLLFEGRGRAA
jgi:hypothetical protein